MKAYHTPAIISEVWTALADVWQIIPVERFHKLVEFMSRRVAASSKTINTRGSPTR